MTKKITLGKTLYSDLHRVFGFSNHEELEDKKARLFPKGNTDREVPTVSIFLATLGAVKEYREELLLELGAKKITTRNVALHVFTELSSDDSADRPDGLIVITSGKHSPIIEWVAFVEAKVGDSPVTSEQTSRYISFASDKGIKEIITISNQLVANPLQSPVTTPKKSVGLYHWSWAYLKVTASRLCREEKIEDEDHVFVLSEFGRYLNEHKNLKHFTNMGKEWKESVNRIHDCSPGEKVEASVLENIATAFSQEEKDVSLHLTEKSKFHVELNVKGDRVEEIKNMLNRDKIVSSVFFLDKDKKQTFTISVNFHQQTIECKTTVVVEEGKAQAQTTSVVRMFEKDAGTTEEILVVGLYQRNKCVKREGVPLSVLLEERDKRLPYSIVDKSLGDIIKTFEIKTKDLLGGEFQKNQVFIKRLEDIAVRFLEQVMANKTS